MVTIHDPGTTTVDRRPDRAPMSPIVALLERLRARYSDLRDGEVATGMLESAFAEPDRFGIAIVTVEGTVYAVGDADVAFTLQAMCRPLIHAAALEAVGEATVRARVGVEPASDPTTSISLAQTTGTPPNPLVSAGAIAATDLVPGRRDPAAIVDESDGSAGSADDPLLALVERFAGRALRVDEAVHRSQVERGHRDRAVAHLLRSNGVLDGEPDAVVDRHLRAGAVQVDVRDLAVIAASLAAGGRNPLTRERAASESTVRSVLSVMTTCGMIEGPGDWFHTVGLPAKTGGSGGILAVLPGQLGIAAWSPRLDARGNTVRGLAVLRDLSRSLGLHLMGAPHAHVHPVRSRSTVAIRHSRRVRSTDSRSVLVRGGHDNQLLELQGNLDFGLVEVVISTVLAEGTPHAVVLDLHRVDWVDPRMAPILADLAMTLGGAEQPALAWSGASRHVGALDAIDALLLASGGLPCPRFGELDAAIEWCEDGILGERPAHGIAATVELGDHAAVRGLDGAAIARLESVMHHRTWVAGELILRRGAPSREWLLITRGQLAVTVPTGNGAGSRRLSTASAGMVLGELDLPGSELLTTDVVADGLVEAWVLEADAFAAVTASDPAIGVTVLRNLLRIAAADVKRMSQELALLVG